MEYTESDMKKLACTIAYCRDKPEEAGIELYMLKAKMAETQRDRSNVNSKLMKHNDLLLAIRKAVRVYREQRACESGQAAAEMEMYKALDAHDKETGFPSDW
jgi:hypothetical protein